MQIPYPGDIKSTMTSEKALQFILATLESKTGKQLNSQEKEIFKAAWDNQTYSSVAEPKSISSA